MAVTLLIVTDGCTYPCSTSGNLSVSPLLPGLVTFSGLTPGEEFVFVLPLPGVGALGGSTSCLFGFLSLTSLSFSSSVSTTSEISGSGSVGSSLSIRSKSLCSERRPNNFNNSSYVYSLSPTFNLKESFTLIQYLYKSSPSSYSKYAK